MLLNILLVLRLMIISWDPETEMRSSVSLWGMRFKPTPYFSAWNWEHIRYVNTLKPSSQQEMKLSPFSFSFSSVGHCSLRLESSHRTFLLLIIQSFRHRILGAVRGFWEPYVFISSDSDSFDLRRLVDLPPLSCVSDFIQFQPLLSEGENRQGKKRELEL